MAAFRPAPEKDPDGLVAALEGRHGGQGIDLKAVCAGIIAV